MNPLSDYHSTEPRFLGSLSGNSNIHDEVEAKHRMLLVQWLNSLLPSLNLPINTKDGELRACLSNGIVLCQILNKLRPGSVNVVNDFDHSLPSQSENVKRFLKALDVLGLPKFEISNLEKGNMKSVVDCLLTLRAKSLQNAWGDNNSIANSKVVRPLGNATSSVHFTDQKKILPESKFQRLVRGPFMPGTNAPTQSLLSVVNGILEESVERRNGEIPQRVACLLRKVVQEIERRISTQSEHLKTQNNLFKVREEKYQSRIKVLEALATGRREDEYVTTSQPQPLKNDKTKMEEKKADDKDVIRLMKEVEGKNMEISTLKEELKIEKTKMEQKMASDIDVIKLVKGLEDKSMEISTLKQELLQNEKTKMEEKNENEKDVSRLMKELDEKHKEISALKQELQIEKTKAEENKASEKDVIRLMREVEDKNMEISTLKQELQIEKTTIAENKASEKDVIRLMREVEDKNMEISTLKQELQIEKIKEAEKKADDKNVVRLMKELVDKGMEISTLKQELETMKKTYQVQCSQLDAKAKSAKGELERKTQEYEHMLENLRNKLKDSESKIQVWNMKQNKLQKALTFQLGSIQELRLSWQSIKQDVMKEQMIYAQECNQLGVNLKPLVDAAENYQEVLSENRKLFHENQDLKGNIRVYCRIRPFLPGQKEKQSIVEHLGETELVVANPSKQGKEALRSFKFNKVYGPASTQVEFIVASLNDAAEVYDDIQGFIRSVLDGFNVCFLDLHTLGIMSHSQPNGLAVPDASMHPVKSTSDVMKLMDIGIKNRAKGSTAMNERSSRSHSVVSIHVRGVDKKTGTSLQGNLHLVDLAGSERIDRSEATGDRLKEAQHINRSLSALGDVIFALAQKNAHVPYRNSKLTQLLQTSLGGQAKTLMLVQINSEIKSFSESLSTLKFAERVSGVELGAARSTKEGSNVRDLYDQIATLKDTIVVKDEEIEQLQLLRDLKNVYPGSEKHETSSPD
ncbi:hypothetical protein RIF29_06571 [Crotalaria pallida]|uniref:Uncharacterized protein n=1 Tax=Crotalaria pallida TaxID=3830 RepID=A0AAN9J470_CROPI